MKRFYSTALTVLLIVTLQFTFLETNAATTNSVEYCVDGMDVDDENEDLNLIPYDFELDGLYYWFINKPFNEVEVSIRPTKYYIDWGESVYPPAYIAEDEGVSTTRVSPEFLDENGMLKIPETISYNGFDYVVTSIGRAGFANLPGIKHVEVPRYMKYIDVGAFSDCENLEKVDFLGNNINSIGRLAFSGCTKLDNIIIPSSVKRISWAIFEGCSSLKNIGFGNNITILTERMFAYNISLTKFFVPSFVVDLREDAFYGCKNLNIYFHDNIESIERGCFDGNEVFTELTLPKNLRYLGAALMNCPNLWHLTIESPNLVLNKSIYAGVCEGSPLKLISLLNPDVLQGNCDEAFPIETEGHKMVFEVKTAMAQKYLEYYTGYMADYVSVEMKSSGEPTVLYVNPCEEENQFDSNYLAKLNKETSLLVNKEQSVVVGWKVNENNISETPYLNGLELTDVTYQDGMALVKLEGLTKNSVFEVKAVNTGVDVVAETAEFEIYSLDGIRLYKGEDESVKASLPKGVYIVKQNGVTTKVLK